MMFFMKKYSFGFFPEKTEILFFPGKNSGKPEETPEKCFRPVKSC
jgi:hypothetical protein